MKWILAIVSLISLIAVSLLTLRPDIYAVNFEIPYFVILLSMSLLYVLVSQSLSALQKLSLAISILCMFLAAVSWQYQIYGVEIQILSMIVAAIVCLFACQGEISLGHFRWSLLAITVASALYLAYLQFIFAAFDWLLVALLGITLWIAAVLNLIKMANNASAVAGLLLVLTVDFYLARLRMPLSIEIETAHLQVLLGIAVVLLVVGRAEYPPKEALTD